MAFIHVCRFIVRERHLCFECQPNKYRIAHTTHKYDIHEYKWLRCVGNQCLIDLLPLHFCMRIKCICNKFNWNVPPREKNEMWCEKTSQPLTHSFNTANWVENPFPSHVMQYLHYYQINKNGQQLPSSNGSRETINCEWFCFFFFWFYWISVGLGMARPAVNSFWSLANRATKCACGDECLKFNTINYARKSKIKYKFFFSSLCCCLLLLLLSLFSGVIYIFASAANKYIFVIYGKLVLYSLACLFVLHTNCATHFKLQCKLHLKGEKKVLHNWSRLNYNVL